MSVFSPAAMALEYRTIGESLGCKASESPVIVVTGKGGVGKSTVSAALAQGLSGYGRSIVVADLDGAPSSADALGGTSEQRERLLVRNDVLRIREHIRVILLGTVIPETGEEHLDDSAAFARELNRHLETFLRDEIDGHPTFLPVMRLAMQSLFYGIPTEAKDLAHILQLIEIIERQRHFVADLTPGNESMSVTPVGQYDHLILDTENTNNLLRMMRVLKRLGRSMQNIHKSVHTGGIASLVSTTRLIVRNTPNLDAYAASHVGNNPDRFIAESERARDLFFSDRSKLVVVTNPGPTETRKTLTDLQSAQQAGKTVSHVLMNRWPVDPALQESAQHIESEFLDAVRDMGVHAGYSRIMPGALKQASPLDPDYREQQQANLTKIIEAMGL